MRLLAPAAAAVLLLVLTGCSEPEPGSPMPTGRAPATSAEPSAAASATTASPTPTNEPTEASEPAPTLPPEATTNDAAGAEAFVRYWFDTLNAAYSSLDAASVEQASTADCEVCQSYVDEIEQMARLGQSLEGARFALTEVVAPAPDGTGAVLVSTTFTLPPGQLIDAEGAVVERISGEKGSVSSVLIREGDSWRMFGIGT